MRFMFFFFKQKTAYEMRISDGVQTVLFRSGLSADHIEHSSEASVRAMAAAGTVAVLLPGAFHVLRETVLPPLDALRAHGVPMAVATDCNPGTSPLQSLRQAMQLGCAHFRLTPEEALRGATVHAAQALGLSDRGVLRVGMRADFVHWRVTGPAELCCWLGGDLAGADRRLAGYGLPLTPDQQASRDPQTALAKGLGP